MRLTKKLTLTAAGAVLAASVAMTGCAKKDPKEVVIDAFKGVVSEDQLSPVEEIFGTKALNELMTSEGGEAGLTLSLDSSSDPQVNSLAGSGIRIEGRSDRTNKIEDGAVTVIYNGMDLVSAQAYIGNDTMMIKIPQLSEQVLTADISEGIIDRIKESPVLGPVMVQQGVDMDGLSAYVEEFRAAYDSDSSPQTLDYNSLWNRYKEGSQAQENFKAAMTVERLDDTRNIMVDGKDVKCTAYQVQISKASMIEFMRTSSDFFLNDEELREEYLRSLEYSVRMSRLLGAYGGSGMMSAEEMMNQSYDETVKAANEMIDFLEKSLSDVDMTVYVTKKGHLAAVEGTTAVTSESSEVETVGLVFSAEVNGGAFRTQNLSAELIMTDADKNTEIGKVIFAKTGVFDKDNWNTDVTVSVASTAANEVVDIHYTGNYDRASGDFDLAGDLSSGGSQKFNFTAAGIIDPIEKGKSYTITLDSLQASVVDPIASIELSGEVYVRPLSGAIEAPQGTAFDIVSSTQEQWFGLVMEMYGGAMQMAQQLGIQLQ